MNKALSDEGRQLSISLHFPLGEWPTLPSVTLLTARDF